MKTKTLNLLSFSLLALIIMISFASAVSFSNLNQITSTPSSVNQDAGSFDISFNITNNEASAQTLSTGNSTLPAGVTITLNDSNIAASATEAIKATISFPINATSPITGIINISNTTTNPSLSFSVPITKTVPDEVKTCYTTGDYSGDLTLEIRDINVIEGFGDDDNYWYPLDEIEIEIKASNDGSDNIDNLEIKWGIYDVDDDSFVIDDKERDFKLKDGDDNTITITFKLTDVNDFQANNYVFYVWANGEVDDSSNTEVCASDSQNIEITNDDDFVRLYDIQVTETASCGDQVQILADVVNLGDSDQDEVKVTIYNSELGINEVIEIGDINDYDSERLDTFVSIPSTATDKTYFLLMKVYDEDGDLYETSEDNEKSEFSVPIKISGCSVASTTKASVSANLESGGKAGENLVVKATVINTGSSSATYTASASGYSTWASSASLDQTTFTLNAGSSKEILMTFEVKDDVSGSQSFNIELVSADGAIITQPVSVSIEEKAPTGFSKISDALSENSYLWAMGIINIILIIVIIVIAIKIIKR